MTIRGFTTLMEREWRTGWTHGGGYALRSGYAAALLLCGVGPWVWGALGFGARVATDMPGYSRDLFVWASRVQFAVATLVGSIGFARALLREKEEDTLESLILSPLSGFEILFAQVLAGVVSMGEVLLAGLPVFAFLLILGGTSPAEILSVHLLLLGHLMGVAAVSMLAGVFVARYFQVVILTWLLLALWFSAPALWLVWPRAAAVPSVLGDVNTLLLLEGELGGVWAEIGVSCRILALGFALMVVACAIGGLFLERQNAARSERRGKAGFLARGRFRLRLLGSRLLPRFLLRRLLPAMTDPLMQRECALDRDPDFGLALTGLVVFYVAGLLVEPLAFGGMSETTIAVANLALPAAALLTIFILCPFQTAIALSGGKRRDRYEALLAANAEPYNIVRAKLAGVAIRVGWLLALPLLHGIVALVVLYPWISEISQGKSPRDPFIGSYTDLFRVLRDLVILILVLLGIVAALVTMILSAAKGAIAARGTARAAGRALLFALPHGLLVGGVVASAPLVAAVAIPGLVPYWLDQYASIVNRFRSRVMSR